MQQDNCHNRILTLSDKSGLDVNVILCYCSNFWAWWSWRKIVHTLSTHKKHAASALVWSWRLACFFQWRFSQSLPYNHLIHLKWLDVGKSTDNCRFRNNDGLVHYITTSLQDRKCCHRRVIVSSLSLLTFTVSSDKGENVWQARPTLCLQTNKKAVFVYSLPHQSSWSTCVCIYYQ